LFVETYELEEGGLDRNQLFSNLLFRGSFAIVKRAINKATGQEVAVKIIDRYSFPLLTLQKELG